jgi:beta-glucanase (GH16 family)
MPARRRLKRRTQAKESEPELMMRKLQRYLNKFGLTIGLLLGLLLVMGAVGMAVNLAEDAGELPLTDGNPEAEPGRPLFTAEPTPGLGTTGKPADAGQPDALRGEQDPPAPGAEEGEAVEDEAAAEEAAGEPAEGAAADNAAAEKAAAEEAVPACGWQVTFADDFDGEELDLRRWETGYKAGDHEAQYYVDDVFEIRDGILRIRAEERKVRDREYASGIITTRDSFTQAYGRFEVRARIPSGQGLWPAFWLLPKVENYPTEIDVFEVLGHQPYRVYMTNHWRGEDGRSTSESYTYRGTDFSKRFHTYAVTWTEKEIIWDVDGIQRARETRGVPQEPMFLLLNLAVGGKWPGYPDETTPFPSYLEIDYVRVYTWPCDESVPEPPMPRPRPSPVPQSSLPGRLEEAGL